MKKTHALIVALDGNEEAINLEYNVNLIASQKCFEEIIVIERSKTDAKRSFNDCVTHIVVKDDKYNRANLVNYAATQCISDMIIVHNYKITVDFRQIISKSNDEITLAFVKPIDTVCSLDKFASKQYLKTRKIKHARHAGQPSIEDCFMMLRSLYILVGGIDEEKDSVVDLHMRVKKWFPVNNFANITGVYVYSCGKTKIEQYVEPQDDGVSFIDAVKAVKSSLRPIEEKDVYLDTCYIVCHWGLGNAERNAGTKESVEWLVESQEFLPRIIFIELTLENEPQFEDHFKDNDYVEYHRIIGNESNKDLFQKENIYQYAIANLNKNERVWIFADSDVIPTSSTWIKDCRTALIENPRVMLSPYRSWRDQIAGGNGQMGIGYRHTQDEDRFYAPGLCWGLSGEYIKECEKIGPTFNRYLFSGSGDCAAIQEHSKREFWTGLYEYHFELDWYNKVIRLDMFDKLDLGYVNTDLFHYHHGAFTTRGYRWSRYFQEVFGSIDQYVYFDHNGLLAWRDPDGPVRKIVKRKSELKGQGSCQRIIFESMLLPWDNNGEKKIDFSRVSEEGMRSRLNSKMKGIYND